MAERKGKRATSEGKGAKEDQRMRFTEKNGKGNKSKSETQWSRMEF